MTPPSLGPRPGSDALANVALWFIAAAFALASLLWTSGYLAAWTTGTTLSDPKDSPPADP